MKRIFLLLPSLFSILAGCKKDRGETEDKDPPVVKITSPSNGQTFSTGQAIAIAAEANDASKLEELHLEITNFTTGVFITHEHYVPDSNAYKLLSNFTPATAAVYKIKVEADDTKGNSGETDINITVR